MLPDDNPKTKFGVMKAPLHLVPPMAIICLANAFKVGAEKYGAYNWRDKTVSKSVYYGACLRHMLAWWDGEDTDPETGNHHLDHAMACLAIIRDGESVGNINDDRPSKGMAASEMVTSQQSTHL